MPFFAFELIQALCCQNPTDFQMSIVRIPSSDQHLPPAAVIVTICSGSSFDNLYTTRPQISPDASRCIAVYRTDYESLPAILSALQQPGSRDCDSEVLRNLVADISAVSAESPDCVLFNFECCSGANSHGFTHPSKMFGGFTAGSALAANNPFAAPPTPVAAASSSAPAPAPVFPFGVAPASTSGPSTPESVFGGFNFGPSTPESASTSFETVAGDPDLGSLFGVTPKAPTVCDHQELCDIRGGIMMTVAHALDRGFMVIFGDFSLKALIKDWDHSLLGPLPFEQVGETSGTVRLRFHREHLIECPSSQLQCVGQLCGDNFAGVHALGGTIQFTVKQDQEATDAYQLQILTVAEAPADYHGPTVTVGQYTGTAGHVLLRYRKGGMLLVSATHWMELTNVNADEAQVALVLLQQQGQFSADKFREELANCQTAEERTACSNRSAVALVQCSPASAPLKSKSK